MNGQFMVTQNNGHGFRSGKMGRDTDQEFVIEDLEKGDFCLVHLLFLGLFDTNSAILKC